MFQRIALITDFGVGSPYMGQLHAVLHGLAPEVAVLDLVADLPPFRPDLAAYLLPALIRDLPRRTLYVCVVDPGVGGDRQVLMLDRAGDCFLGPDNGLLAVLGRRSVQSRWWRVTWRPKRLSASFHGRDLFAPLAVRLARGKTVERVPVSASGLVGMDWVDEPSIILYRDAYGNLMTGLRAANLSPSSRFRVAGHWLSHARTFCEVPQGAPFWYENSLGLVEFAVNRGRADQVLGLYPGDSIDIMPSA